MSTITRIAVATDFSPSAQVALEWASRFAHPLGAQLHLVHAWQLPVLLGAAGAYLATPEVSASLEHDLGKELSRLADTHPVAATHLVKGAPENALQQVVEQAGCEMVVVGSQGYSALEHVLFGSVAERILRTSEVAVTVVPRSFAPRMNQARLVQQVMVPIALDADEKESEVVARQGLFIARHMRAQLHAVHAAELPVYVQMREGLTEESERALRAELSGVMQRIGASAPEARSVVRAGPCATVLLEHIERERVDLVVMRTHGRGVVERFFLGSMTETMIRKSGVPVMVLPAQTPSGVVALPIEVPNTVVPST